jgi:type I restriction enzyme M protein
LAKGAEDVKSGAGQYFTPRALIAAMVDCVRPDAEDTVCDPACGTGGFLLAAHARASHHAERLTPEQRAKLRDDYIYGVELVDGTARLAAMNLLCTASARRTGRAASRCATRWPPTTGTGTPSCSRIRRSAASPR